MKERVSKRAKEIKMVHIWAYMSIQITSQSSSTAFSIHSAIPTLYKLICDVIQQFNWTMYLTTDKSLSS